MTPTKEEARQKIEELVEKYQKLTAKEIKGFNEAKTKQGFIEPMFRALGWDFENTNEVSPEENASEGRVDYAFKLNGVSQFYVEAKSFKEDVNDPKHIKQAVTYAFIKGVTWGVLTNFSGLRVFNAHKDWAFISLDYNNYSAGFDKLWLLSRESVETGLLKQESINWVILPTPIPIEKRLFAQLRTWRQELFDQLRGHNQLLNQIQIDDIIQKLFNRLLFIRNCEDRGIEEPRLLAALNQWKTGNRKKEQLSKSLYQIFQYYNINYDSDLFDKHIIDSEDVIIEEDTIENILSGLYDIPGTWLAYDFKIIDADVLGAVYEQYLGYVAIKAKEKAEAQLKLGIIDDETFIFTKLKSHRKEQGIYYTPEIITDYIVKETVGRFITEHSPQDPTAIRNIKILDPACGSGSFLIRAYQELLNYHAYQCGKLSVQLKKEERETILLKNIFGVDLDRQAVDVARLNLLIRSLSGQYHLPPLKDNIKTGNSLISGTDGELKDYFGEKWKDKNPFNWDDEFEDIMKNGGFDVVIGNPPYVGFQGFNEDKEYLKNKYKTCSGRFDLYIPFVEKGLMLLRDGGLLGFICPTNFTKRQHGHILREILKEKYTIIKIIDFQDQQIFEGALNYTGIFILQKSKAPLNHKIIYISKEISSNPIAIRQDSLEDNGWVFRDKDSDKVIKTIQTTPHMKLDELSEGISEGIVTGKNEVFLLDNSEINKLDLELEILKPIAQGKDIQKYHHFTPKYFVIYPYQNKVDKTEVIPEGKLQKLYPQIWSYLCVNKTILSGRDYFTKTTKTWFELWCERSLLQQAAPKIIVPELSASNRFSYCDETIFYLDTACGIILKNKQFNHYLYVLSLLNSSLIEFFYKKTTVPKANGFFIYKTMFLKNIPIYSINFNNKIEKNIHDSLVTLAEKMTNLRKQLNTLSDYEIDKKGQLEHEIKATDDKINNMVYDLYGLTEEERKIVEGQTVDNTAKT